MADRPILDLTSDTSRPVVKIDGVPYPLRTSRDLTLQNFKFLERVSIRVGELLTLEDLDGEQEAELAARLKEIVDVCLDAPADVTEDLSDIHRVLIFKVFTELLTPGLLLATRAIQTPNRFPGTRPSSVSSGSMASRRKHGSPVSRSGSSKRR